jgi:hypothetical protein
MKGCELNSGIDTQTAVFVSSRRVLLILKRAMQLRIPLEKAFDHINPAESRLRIGVNTESFLRLREQLRAGEPIHKVFPAVAPHLLSFPLQALFSYSEKNGQLDVLVDALCAPSPDRGDDNEWSVWNWRCFVMALHGLHLVLLYYAAVIMIPKLFVTFGCVPTAGNDQFINYPAGLIGGLGLLLFTNYPVVLIGGACLLGAAGFLWLMGQKQQWRAGLVIRRFPLVRLIDRASGWETAQMLCAVDLILRMGGTESAALQELQKASITAPSRFRKAISKALELVDTGSSWREVFPVLVSPAGSRAAVWAAELTQTSDPFTSIDSFCRRTRHQMEMRFRWILHHLLPLEPVLAGVLTGYMLLLIYRTINFLVAAVGEIPGGI